MEEIRGTRLCSDLDVHREDPGACGTPSWGSSSTVTQSDSHLIMKVTLSPLWEDCGVWRLGTQMWKQGDL
jgi:hypothetical protein